jgi:hypothetical protein
MSNEVDCRPIIAWIGMTAVKSPLELRSGFILPRESAIGRLHNENSALFENSLEAVLNHK